MRTGRYGPEVRRDRHPPRREINLLQATLFTLDSIAGNLDLEESFFSSTKEDQIRIDAASALSRIGGTEAMGYIHRAKGSKRKAVRTHCEGLIQSHTEAR